jgi:hypothetical protein
MMFRNAILAIFTFLSMPLGMALAIEPQLTGCLKSLQTAASFDTKAIGYSGENSKNFLAYEEAARQGSKIRTKLDWLVLHASPAGRLYSALLIRRLDTKAGHAALCRLTNDKSVVNQRLGCLVGQTTVSSQASRLLGVGSTSINSVYSVK